MGSNTVYYGEVGSYGVVFVRDRDACRLARIHWAIASSKTWGEFAGKVPLKVLDDLLGGSDRLSFHDFCKGWLYQSLAWPEKQAGEWFTDAIAAYRAKPSHERYPLPEEACWAREALAESNWPGFPPQFADRWMPPEIIQQYGVVRGGFLCEDQVIFEPDHKQAIIAALEKRGYACSLNDMLVNLACGNGGTEGRTNGAREIIESAERNC